MARLDQRNPDNAPGDWYVDLRCIDCDACRELAPTVFTDAGSVSVVHRQPDGALDAVWRAVLTCPTQSIGHVDVHRRPPAGLLPFELDAGVYFCGYNAEDSFGANSFLAVRPEGNVLVDSPRFTRRLAEPIADLGGIDHVLLTHQDDVADADRWAEQFGARVWIHAADAHAAPYATDVFDGVDDVTVRPGLVAVPVPGHTRGSAVFVLEERFAFTGDSLFWDRRGGDLAAHRNATWYSWREQGRSLARLAATHRFEWVLAGHGDRERRPAGEMHERLAALAARMG